MLPQLPWHASLRDEVVQDPSSNDQLGRVALMPDNQSDYSQPILEGQGASDYERYLRTDELLALQKSDTERVHRDELLFQTVHQASELWLKLAGFEMDGAAERIEHGQVPAALRLMRRAVKCLDYVIDQMAMLTRMDPWEYQQIRVVLGHGSGFDSPGFRGLSHVTQRASRALTSALADAGLSLEELYVRGREFEALHAAAELPTDWDERIWVWRFRHYAVVARSLGEHTVGTQGTPVQVLGRLIAQRQVVQLWDIRGRLVERFDATR